MKGSPYLLHGPRPLTVYSAGGSRAVGWTPPCRPALRTAASTVSTSACCAASSTAACFATFRASSRALFAAFAASSSGLPRLPLPPFSPPPLGAAAGFVFGKKSSTDRFPPPAELVAPPPSRPPPPPPPPAAVVVDQLVPLTMSLPPSKPGTALSCSARSAIFLNSSPQSPSVFWFRFRPSLICVQRCRIECSDRPAEKKRLQAQESSPPFARHPLSPVI